MTKEGWKLAVMEAVSRHENGDSKLLELMAELLEAQDAAKQALREKGYGWIGLPWDETVDLIEDRR